MKRAFPKYESSRDKPADKAGSSSKHTASRDESAAVPARIRLLSWNVDMDTEFKHMRTRGLISQIRETKPDVVMLQEVTSEKVSDTSRDSVLSMLRSSLCPASNDDEVVEVIDSDSDDVKAVPTPGTNTVKTVAGDDDVIEVTNNSISSPPAAPKQPASKSANPKSPAKLAYDMHLPHATHGYFCVLLVRRGLLRAGSLRVSAEAFENSMMMRGLISLQGQLSQDGARVAFLTSHLESLPFSAERRKSQLADIVQQCRELATSGCTAIFGGDTNLREREISAYDVAKTPVAEAKRNAAANAAATSTRRTKRTRVEQKLGDAWVMAGCPERSKFTWDTLRNDNLALELDFKPRARYDRVFMLGPELRFPRVTDFKLLGTKRLNACDKFISDHFGVLVDIDVLT